MNPLADYLNQNYAGLRAKCLAEREAREAVIYTNDKLAKLERDLKTGAITYNAYKEAVNLVMEEMS